jgi:hypothetical protein
MRISDMTPLLQLFSTVVKGVISGFDRIVFKGSILPLMHKDGAASFLRRNGVLNKDYKNWVIQQTQRVVEPAEKLAQTLSGQKIIPIPLSSTRKETLARERERQFGIESGLIGVWSATESCLSYKARYSVEKGFPQLRMERTKCKHLYFYFNHEQFGFMNIRLQTWFPYHIQICMNGREWLRRQLQQQGIGFAAMGNKFLHIDNYLRAQSLLNDQLDARFAAMLEGFLPTVFPAMSSILGPSLSYYWTLWQSEWATDYIFTSPKAIEPIWQALLQHAFMTGTSTRVLRYLDRPITAEGKPYLNMNHDVLSRVLDFQDGLRVRHWVDNNSVKVYTQQNVLRIETTINDPGMFKVHRHAQGESKRKPKRRMALRKGVADIPLRAQVSQDINHRFETQLATFQTDTALHEVIVGLCQGRTQSGRRIRGLDITGKDRALLLALSDSSFELSGITNKALRQKLYGQQGFRNLTDKQLSAKVSRQLRLLRDHGLIRKYPRQRKYGLTTKGRQLSITLPALLNASVKELMDIAA